MDAYHQKIGLTLPSSFCSHIGEIYTPSVRNLLHFFGSPALDYVSDYHLKSACKDAICIAPSQVTEMIFAVLED